MTNLEVETIQPKPPAEDAPWQLANLPPFPVVATRLMQMLAREDVDIAEVGKMISAEPVFATRVLQMANSPLFALTRQVKTISHAIVVLGLGRIKSITITRALGDFMGPALNFKILRVCWRNSLAVALVAERLAPVCRLDPDFAYVAGLLRDIGRLAMLVKYPESYANMLAVTREYAFDLRATERELFEIDHCEAGAWLVERLPFPEELCEVVAHHHDPIDSPFRMVHLIRIADEMADALGFAVIPSTSQPSFEQILEELPERFRSRFIVDPEELAAEIESKLRSWL
jgi:putative nucleotidyltransferase with HDIG domain